MVVQDIGVQRFIVCAGKKVLAASALSQVQRACANCLIWLQTKTGKIIPINVRGHSKSNARSHSNYYFVGPSNDGERCSFLKMLPVIIVYYILVKTRVPNMLISA